MYNKDIGALEGSDDPGRVFVRRLNVRALACALSLLNVQVLRGLVGLQHQQIRLRKMMQLRVRFSLKKLPPDPVDNSEHLYDTAVDAPLGTVTVFTGAREGQKMPCQYGVAMVTGMPRFNTAFELPMPHDSWSPEAMITWM